MLKKPSVGRSSRPPVVRPRKRRQRPDSGGKDVFVHISAVERAGLQGLQEGQKISYDVQVERGKEAAANLKV